MSDSTFLRSGAGFKRIAAVIAAAALALGSLTALQTANATSAAAAEGTEVVFDSIPAELAGNYSGQPFAALQTSEFGELVELGGANRSLETVTVLFSSWACEIGTWKAGCETSEDATFTHDITVNIYEPGTGAEPGALIASVTEPTTLPYRPSSTPELCGGSNKYFSAVDDKCYDGITALGEFDFGGVSVGDQVIVAVAFAPTGPAASLNVAVMIEGKDPTTPSTGSIPEPDSLYVNSAIKKGGLLH